MFLGLFSRFQRRKTAKNSAWKPTKQVLVRVYTGWFYFPLLLLYVVQEPPRSDPTPPGHTCAHEPCHADRTRENMVYVQIV